VTRLGQPRDSVNLHCVAFSPDGKLLATGGDHGRGRLWDTATRTLLGPAGRDHGHCHPCLSPDGQTLATLDPVWIDRGDTVCLWEMATGKLMRTLKQPDELVEVAAFSPTGRLLAVATRKQVFLWDASTGKVLWQKPTPPHVTNFLAFTPDGTALAE